MKKNLGRVIVVGAGVSGIAAAYRLQQRGYEVTVLEKADYIGGKARTVNLNGYIVEEGASVLPSKYTNVLNMARELGMESELTPGGSIVGFARGDKIHYMDSARLVLDSLTTGLISWQSKLKMINVAIDNFRIKSKLDYEDITKANAFDFETAQQYCKRRANDEIFDYIVDGTLRGMLGTSGEVQSVVDFFFSFNNVIGSKLLSFRKGMGYFPNAIVEKAGLHVRLNTTVEEVRETNGRVLVSYNSAEGSRTEEVDGVIVALPAFAAAKLVPALTESAKDILNSIRYTTAVNINLGLRAPPANIPAFVIQIPKSVHPDLFAIVMEHNKAPGRVPAGKGMASLYAMSDWSEKLIDMDDAAIVSQMSAAADRLVPGLSGMVEFAHVNRWYPVIVYSDPGVYRRIANLKTELDPKSRIKLAGDYWSCSTLNTATAGGERAARELGVLLGAS